MASLSVSKERVENEEITSPVGYSSIVVLQANTPVKRYLQEMSALSFEAVPGGRMGMTKAASLRHLLLNNINPQKNMFKKERIKTLMR